ncbi:hypothetical protein NM688_g3527 [Phlebia brevispora]|uniref:Uncharacterized protein n=1 Tax=Phlebia brevispora TaxID=194682 RepID=A0ACC1T5M9_9APHY|nr:hypothetical protein NM688_g3527 [Phlebia brevispora]
MFAKIASLAILAAAALSVNAQTIDSCIISCSAAAASAAGCSSYADLPCVCTNTNFQTAAAACISATCPSGDLAAAQALEALECGTLVSKLTTPGSSL